MLGDDSKVKVSKLLQRRKKQLTSNRESGFDTSNLEKEILYLEQRLEVLKAKELKNSKIRK
jgi:hypothetical protein